MPRKTSKLNFLDSLLGGLARGFSFSQQLQNQQKQREQNKRRIDLQERGVNIREDELDLKTTAAQNKLDFLNSISNAPDRRDLLQQLINPVQAGAGTVQQQATVPSVGPNQAPDLSVPQPDLNLIGKDFQFNDPTARSPFNPLQSPLEAGLPTAFEQDTGFVNPNLRNAPEQISQELIGAGKGLIGDQPLGAREIEGQLPIPDQQTLLKTQEALKKPPKAPIRGPQLKGTVNREAADDFNLQLLRATQEEGISVSVDGVTRKVNPKLTDIEALSFAQQFYRKQFKTSELNPIDFAQTLRKSPLRDLPAFKKFFARKFGPTVSQMERRVAAQLGLSRVLPSQKDLIKRESVQRLANIFGLDEVPKRFQKFATPAEINSLNLENAFQLALSRISNIQSKEDFLSLPATERNALAEKVYDKMGLEVIATKGIVTDGKTTQVPIVLKNRDTNEVTGKLVEVSPKFFGAFQAAGRDAFQTPAARKVIELNDRRDAVVRTLDSVENVAKVWRGFSEAEKTIFSTPAGSISVFFGGLADTLRGLANVGQLTIFETSESLTEKLLGSADSAFRRLNTKEQKFATQYALMTLQFAGSSVLAKGGRLSDQDINRAEDITGGFGISGIEGSLEALHDSQNADLEALNNNIIKLRDPKRNLFTPVPRRSRLLLNRQDNPSLTPIESRGDSELKAFEESFK